MGRHKPRPTRDYRRRGPTREPYDVVLIVCEGKKTEPEYLRGLQKVYRLSNANLKVMPGDGHDPVSIVNFALEEYDKSGGDYDRIFCVFDRDGHANYDEAVNMIAASPLGREGELRAITSVPCFEIWILLHFAYTTASFVRTGNKSACDNVVDRVRGHFPEYQKALAGVFEKLQPKLDTAVTNAKHLSKHNRDTRSENPATRVHELVAYLRALKRW